MEPTLGKQWWALAIRGAAAILFGLSTFLWPGAGLLALVLLFGAYALADGVFNLVLAVHRKKARERWGSLVLEGIVSLAAGVFTLLLPGMSALALLFLIAAWAVVTGGAEIAAAIRLRKAIKGEWLLALSGVLSIVFGLLLFLFPGSGALAVVLWIGAYAMAFGALLVALAFKLRSWTRSPSRRVPREDAPVPA